MRSLVISCLHCFLFIPRKGIDSFWKTNPSFKFPSFDSSSEICSPLSPLDKPLHQPPSSNLPLILQVLRKFSTTYTHQSPESPTQYPNLPTNLPNNQAAPTTFPLLPLRLSKAPTSLADSFSATGRTTRSTTNRLFETTPHIPSSLTTKQRTTHQHNLPPSLPPHFTPRRRTSKSLCTDSEPLSKGNNTHQQQHQQLSLPLHFTTRRRLRKLASQIRNYSSKTTHTAAATSAQTQLQ